MAGYDDWRFGNWDTRSGMPPGAPRGRGPLRGTGGAHGYDRGIYGDAYPGYGGGYPGGPQRGGGYGGGSGGGYDRGYQGGGRGASGYAYGGYGYVTGGGWPQAERGGWQNAWPEGGAAPVRGGYDGDFAREPFVPEEAYRRHPEYRQERHRDPYPAGAAFDEYEPEDEDILHEVRRRMERDPWLDPDKLQVEVEDGVVTLRGEVNDFLEARYAWDDAWESPGVRGVVNQITVRTDRPNDEHGDMMPQSAGNRAQPGDLGL